MRALLALLVMVAAGPLSGQGIPGVGSISPSESGTSGGAGNPEYINSVCGPASPASGGGPSAAVNMTGANLFVLFTGYVSESPSLTVTDSQSDTPAAITAANSVTGDPVLNVYYFQDVTGVSGETFSVTASGQYPGFCVLGFSNMAASGVYETGTQVAASGTQSGAATATYGSHNLFIAGGASATYPSAISLSGSGWSSPVTINAGNAFPVGMSYLIQSGTSPSQNPAWIFTGGTSGEWSLQAVFQGAQ